MGRQIRELSEVSRISGLSFGKARKFSVQKTSCLRFSKIYNLFICTDEIYYIMGKEFGADSKPVEKHLWHKGGEDDDKTLVMCSGRNVPDGIYDNSLLARTGDRGF